MRATGPKRLARDAGPQAPTHLAPATAEWWRNVVTSWELDEHHIRLLTLACEAFDRAEEARVVVARRGATFRDRFGQPKVRPEAEPEALRILASALWLSPEAELYFGIQGKDCLLCSILVDLNGYLQECLTQDQQVVPEMMELRNILTGWKLQIEDQQKAKVAA